jgi:hypothetical protein
VINEVMEQFVISLAITLDNTANSVVTLEGPVGSFDYQVGSTGAILDYSQFVDYLVELDMI